MITYKVVQAAANAKPDELEALLNGLAAQGWHLATGYVNGGWPTFVFERAQTDYAVLEHLDGAITKQQAQDALAASESSEPVVEEQRPAKRRTTTAKKDKA